MQHVVELFLLLAHFVRLAMPAVWLRWHLPDCLADVYFNNASTCILQAFCGVCISFECGAAAAAAEGH